jgi:hypothetical protein
VKIDDLSAICYSEELHRGATVRSIGWLGSEITTRGPVDPVVLERLRHYHRVAFHDDGDLGHHVCEICGSEPGRGEFWIEWAGVRYVLPSLVVHYCEAHGYLPPEEFLSALHRRWLADAG